MKYGLIAEKLGHSFSKTIHEMIDDYDYEMKELPKDKLHDFMTKRDFCGINVTIPYKQEVIPYIDVLSDTAKKIGAVNTVINKDGRLYGYNTDFGGMTALIQKTGLDLKNKKVLILGTGGTSKTAKAVSESLGAKEIIFVSRTKKQNAVSYEEAYKNHADCDVLINTTPCGMFPNIDGSPCSLQNFSRLCGVIDAVFNPLSSKIVLAARERKTAAEGGLYMLVSQAVLAAKLFTGKKYSENIADDIFKKLLCQKKNIVLIGMPGSGKTTIGKLIAQKLGREFVDLDEWIVKKTGRQITEIFSSEGEKYFRTLETAAAAEIAKMTGIVISTGGGSVLKKQNVDFLKMNGSLIFLNRPIEKLMPTADRPLADSERKIRGLYETRMPIYSSCADIMIDIADDADDNAENVIKMFYDHISEL